MRNNLAPLAAMAVFAAVFVAMIASGQNIVWCLALAALTASAGYFLLRGAYPANDELEAYDLDARRRVKKVLDSVRWIEDRANQVQDAPTREALLKGCEIIPRVLGQTRDKETTGFKVASTAAQVQNYLT